MVVCRNHCAPGERETSFWVVGDPTCGVDKSMSACKSPGKEFSKGSLKLPLESSEEQSLAISRSCSALANRGLSGPGFLLVRPLPFLSFIINGFLSAPSPFVLSSKAAGGPLLSEPGPGRGFFLFFLATVACLWVNLLVFQVSSALSVDGV